jgi:hypothetical protein
MRTGDAIAITFTHGSKCSPATSWDPVVKIYASGSCGDGTTCGNKLACEATGNGTYTTQFTAPSDAWYFVIVDGRASAFDDSGDYKLSVKLTCAQPSCGC